MFKMNFKEQADVDIDTLKRSEPQAYKKLVKLLLEIADHPTTGTGKPEQLRGRANEWSRRITQKHRLIYRIESDQVLVLVLSAYGHYADK